MIRHSTAFESDRLFDDLPVGVFPGDLSALELPQVAASDTDLLSVPSGRAVVFRSAMAARLYGKSLLLDCWITLGESSNRSGWPGSLPDPPAPMPEIRFGRSGLVVNTRCPDFGEVDLEVWAGDPGPVRPGWKVVFDGELETVAQGFDVGMLGILFHVDASPGTYRIRAETHRGDEGYVDGVRFSFPESPDLVGDALD